MQTQIEATIMALTLPQPRAQTEIHRDIRTILKALSKTDADAVEMSLKRQTLLEALAIDVQELERNAVDTRR